MKRMRKIANNLCIATLIASVLSGCGFVPSVDLTKDEVSVISEYAAGLVMKYQRGHANGVMKVPGLDENDFTPTPVPELPVEEIPDIEDSELLEEESDALVDSLEITDEGDDYDYEEETVIPLNEAFGLYGMELIFDHCEICKSYPTDEDELTFSMNATEGKDLLIAHFNLYNPNMEDEYCQTSLDGRKVRLIVNDEERLRGEITILANDLLNYSNTVAAQTAEDVVLVFEILEGAEINSITLSLVGKEDILDYKL